MFDLTLEHGYGVLTMLAVAAVAILLTGIFYRRAFSMLRPRQRRILLALRILAIAVVVLLLFRPVLTYRKSLDESPALIFLLDRSSSMSICDDSSGAARFDQARARLEAWWPRLNADFTPHLLEFAERAEPLDELSQLAGLTPDGKATSLSGALISAARLLPRGDVEAVVLLTDGIHNSARNPLELAGQLGIVVHTVGVGASLRSDASYRDVQVTGIDCPEQMTVDNLAQITASIEGIGLAGRVLQVVLEEDGQPKAEAELALDDVEGSQEVQFEIRPATKGRHTYVVRAGPIGEENIKENNTRRAIAMAVEPGIRVLYVEGTLRPEYGALVDRFLAKDPDLEFCALVQTRPNFFLKRSNIAGLELTAIPADSDAIDAFDVFIFGDVDASYFRPQQQELFLQRVRNGAGLLMLGGYHSLGPGGYGNSPLGKGLPVVLGDRDVGQVTDSFLPELTPDGVRHPIFTNIADFFPTRTGPPKTAGLPPLDGCTRVQQALPGSTVLAVCPLDDKAMPVLATRPLGSGRTAVFCGDTTRKWQQGPRALDQESPFLRFWGQMVRWLAGRSGEMAAEASVAATTDKGYYEPEETIAISAVVRDEQGEGAQEAKVVAQILGPSGKARKVALAGGPQTGGRYRATFQPDGAGSHEIVVEARLGELTIQSEKLTVEVGRPNLEFEKLDLDEKLLTRIAADTGGRYVHISTADRLIDQFDRTRRRKTRVYTRPLFWPRFFWLLFVGALTTEWVMRRRFQLR